MDQQHLDFFKQILEGKALYAFGVYLKKHEQSLKKQLPRGQFLRLKFKPLEEIEIILQQNNITYQLNPQAIKREKYLLCFHDSVLDENGFPTAAFEASLFNGAAHDFLNSAPEKASQKLHDYVWYTTNNNNNHAEILENFEEVGFHGTIEIEYGNQALGIFLLQYIAQQASDCSRISNLILNAKTTLQSLSATTTQNPSLSA